MTDQPDDEFTANDQRRAAALMAHYGNRNIDGMNAVLADEGNTWSTSR